MQSFPSLFSQQSRQHWWCVWCICYLHIYYFQGRALILLRINWMRIIRIILLVNYIKMVHWKRPINDVHGARTRQLNQVSVFLFMLCIYCLLFYCSLSILKISQNFEQLMKFRWNLTTSNIFASLQNLKFHIYICFKSCHNCHNVPRQYYSEIEYM